MRLIKAQNTNLRNIYGKGIKYDVNNQVVVDSTNSIVLPVGASVDRPEDPTFGHIRYNTTLDGAGIPIGFEVWENEWKRIRFKEPNQNPGIHQQNLGNGDAVETTFGTLNSQDPDYPVPAAAQNVLVFVENVFQISGTNYELIQNPTELSPSTGEPYPLGWYIRFESPPDIGKPITVLHNFDK
jgi:hypothetical protein